MEVCVHWCVLYPLDNIKSEVGLVIFLFHSFMSPTVQYLKGLYYCYFKLSFIWRGTLPIINGTLETLI